MMLLQQSPPLTFPILICLLYGARFCGCAQAFVPQLLAGQPFVAPAPGAHPRPRTASGFLSCVCIMCIALTFGTQVNELRPHRQRSAATNMLWALRGGQTAPTPLAGAAVNWCFFRHLAHGMGLGLFGGGCIAYEKTMSGAAQRCCCESPALLTSAGQTRIQRCYCPFLKTRAFVPTT